MGHTKESTRKAAHTNDLITSSPGFIIQKLTTPELWAPPPILPHHKNVHLVILTHGLHSNGTADMLYLKDRIEQVAGLTHRPDGGVIVRGYSGNVCKTERGIKWLGKRLARWLLHETLWLDQVGCFAPDAPPYSRISFIGHSLGGVVQNFAIAMVELMTNGQFFRKLRPVHLITLASPWLGVSAENPAYVKLALDVGLIGRTGQDLGLMSRLGQRFDNVPDKKQIRDSRPILRLLALPNSPAHRVIRLFCTRTIYANVVNDGIVPLRTSAMFFLDWSSLDTVQKSVGQNGVLSGGLSTLDNFFGGVERIFGPRRSEDESRESNAQTSPDQSSTDSKSQLFVSAFLRRKSTRAVPTRKSNKQDVLDNSQGRRSRPSINRLSFDVEREVREAMAEDIGERKNEGANVQVDNIIATDLKQNLGAWNEERGGEAWDGNTTTEPRTIHIATESPESMAMKHGLDDTNSSQTSSKARKDLQLPKPITEHLQVDDVDPTDELQKLSQQSSSDDSEPSPTSNNLAQITSNQLVESPTETNKQHEFQCPKAPSGPRSEKGATGPPKDEEQATGDSTGNPLFSLFQHLRPGAGKSPMQRKFSKVYHRSQTISKTPSEPSYFDVRPPPPRTTFFESFPSLINPPLPDVKFITQPSCRPKTIFHDRLYTPEDIPPVSPRERTDLNLPSANDEQLTKREKLRLEEKIARDWHSDMTWRKVLVKLEPDAHNNIIVRRMFPNAYGWPVIEHLVQEHFQYDPEGLESEFTQEVGVIPIPFEEEDGEMRGDGGARSPSWESPMMDLESEDEMGDSGISEQPESVGRALMSDEENGDVVEMMEFSSPKVNGNDESRDDVVVEGCK